MYFYYYYIVMNPIFGKYAYLLSCQESEKMELTRTFTRSPFRKTVIPKKGKLFFKFVELFSVALFFNSIMDFCPISFLIFFFFYSFTA